MILRVTDGTTTVNLAGGTDGFYLAEDFVPRPPEVSPIEVTAEAMRDGGELLSATRRNVAESVSLTVVGASRSAVVAAQHELERLLLQAQTRQERGVGAPVFVEYRKSDSGDIYRSEILRGTFEPSPETAGEMWWDAGAVAATVGWQRRYYWEGPETALPLSGNTPGAWVSIDNCNDASRDNYVDIEGSDVEGVIPAACRIELQNSYDVASRLYTVYIGHNVWSNPTTMTSVLEGENTDYGGTSVANADASGDYYRAVTWGGDMQTQALRWVLSTAMLNAYAGGWFRLLARFTSSPAGIKLQLKVTFPSGTPLTPVAEAPEVTLGSGHLQDLGVLQLPPWLRGESGLYPVDLTLYARKEGGGTFNLDFIQITPLDGYRVLTPRGYGAAYGVTLVDDGTSGEVYTSGWGSSYKTGHYLSRGDRIMLWPGRDQRLCVLGTNSSGSCEVARTYSIRVYYRPRRLTL